MNEQIFNEFMDVECNSHVRELLLKTINGGLSTESNSVEDLSFNRFNVSIDFGKKSVTIEDVIMYDDDIYSTSVDEFLEELNKELT